MTNDDVIQKLQTVFDSVFIDEVKVSRDLSAKDVEEWDSVLHVSLVVAVEEAFKIKFRVGEVEGTKNVGDFIDLIIKRARESGVA
jgi:acyl carrier protein